MEHFCINFNFYVCQYLSLEHVISLPRKIGGLIFWPLDCLLGIWSVLIPDILSGHLLHFLENVWVLDVIGHGVDQRIVKVL
jgi:hypothetical protein